MTQTIYFSENVYNITKKLLNKKKKRELFKGKVTFADLVVKKTCIMSQKFEIQLE